jgi:hypothetical protein
MLMLVKQTRLLTDIENVSKTKIRGIFALLKNSHAMVTAGPEGESVRINLGKGITTFRHFREKQDSFISKCVTLQQIFIPYETKGDLIWQLDPVTMQLRVEELWSLEVSLHEFISNEITKIRTSAVNRPPQNAHRVSRSGFSYHAPVRAPVSGLQYRDHSQYSLPSHSIGVYEEHSLPPTVGYDTHRVNYQGSSFPQEYSMNESYSGSGSFPSASTWPSSTGSVGDVATSHYHLSEHSPYFEDERSPRG